MLLMKYKTSWRTSYNSFKQDNSCIKRILRSNKEKLQLQYNFSFLMNLTIIGKCMVNCRKNSKIQKRSKPELFLNYKPFRKAHRFLRRNILLIWLFINLSWMKRESPTVPILKKFISLNLHLLESSSNTLSKLLIILLTALSLPHQICMLNPNSCLTFKK